MKLFCQHYWKIIYKVLSVIGGIIGYYLFFPRVMTVFYDFLTKYGFHNIGFQEFLKRLPYFLMLFLWTLAFCALLIDVFGRFRFSYGEAVLYWGNKCFLKISDIGCCLGIVYVFCINKFDFALKIWLACMFVLVLLRLTVGIFQGELDYRKNSAKRWGA